MKEEQNALSSSNYDVTLYHPRLPTTSKRLQSFSSTNRNTYKRDALAPLRGGLDALRFAKSVLALRVLSKRS